MSKELPARWAKRLAERGFVDGRSQHVVPSMGALSTKTGLHTSTISAAISGKRKPSMETVRILVRELGADVADWLGVPIREPYEPPAEADLLTPRQRKALSELIRAFVSDEQDQGGGEGERRDAPANQAAEPDLPEQTGADNRPPLLAVASGDEGDEALAREATARARKARKEQLDAIKAMKRKRGDRDDKGDNA